MEHLTAVIGYDLDSGFSSLALVGVLRLANSSIVRSGIARCLAEHPLAILVDLNRMVVLEPRSLIVFAGLTQRLAKDDAKIYLYSDPRRRNASSLRRGLPPWVPIYANRTEAIEASRAASARRARMHTHLTPNSSAPATGRALVRRACEAWDLADYTGRAELIVSELVSNAVLHANTDFDLTVVLRGPYLIIQVRDGSPETPRSASIPAPSDTGGRGLKLVDSLATSWGTAAQPDGKTVWATLRVHH